MLNILCFGLHMESFLHPVKKRKVKPRQSKRSKKPLKKLNKPKVKSTCLPSKKKKKKRICSTTKRTNGSCLATKTTKNKKKTHNMHYTRRNTGANKGTFVFLLFV